MSHNVDLPDNIDLYKLSNDGCSNMTSKTCGVDIHVGDLYISHTGVAFIIAINVTACGGDIVTAYCVWKNSTNQTIIQSKWVVQNWIYSEHFKKVSEI